MNKLLIYIFVTLLLIITFRGALAISVDADDSVVASAGDTISQSLILYDFGDNLDAVELSARNVLGDSTTSWFTLSNGTNFTGVMVNDNSAFIDYKIRIPDDAPVGIYRAVFDFSNGDDVVAYNVKVSVQNRFIAGFDRFINRSVFGSFSVGGLLVGFVLLLVFLYILFSVIGYGGFYGKKKR